MKKVIIASVLLAICFQSFSQSQFNTLWVKDYGGTNEEYAVGATLIPDDGFLITGRTESADGNLTNNYGMYDAIAIKTDSEGNYEWIRNYGGSSNDIFQKGRPTPDGGFIFVGQSSSDDHDLTVNYGNYDIWVVKTDQAGNIQWQKSIGDAEYNYALDVVVDTDGYIVLSNLNDLQAFKISLSGEIMWERNYNTMDGVYYMSSITKTNDGNFALGGQKFGNNNFWVVIIKIDSQGNMIYKREYERNNVRDIKTILCDNDNNLLIGGIVNSTSSNFWGLKTNSNGNIIWEKRLSSDYEELFQVSLADNGYVFSGYGSHDEELGNYTLVTNFEGDSLMSFFANPNDIHYGTGGLAFKMSDDAFITITSFQLIWTNMQQILMIKTCIGNELAITLSDETYCPPAQLWANEGFSSYRWTKGYFYDSVYYGNSRIIDVSEGGRYNLVAYNQNGCPSYASIDVPDPIYTPQRKDLCFVTVDEISGKNKLIFSEINPQSVVDSIYIYRTDEFNQHVVVGRLSINDNDFIDLNSYPQQQSYIYSVANLDTCGLIVGGNKHTTLHLQSSLGSNNEVNLSWSQYQGISYDYTELYRSVYNSGIWSEFIKIAQLPLGTQSYTDLNAPEGHKKYQIRITPPDNCAGSMKLCSNTETAFQCSTFSVDVLSGNAHCGKDDGYIIAKANGGSSPYIYIWNGFIEGDSLLNIPAGTYHLSITDAEGCITEKTISISKNEPIIWAESTPDDIRTPECEGKITLYITGADLPAYCLVNNQPFFIINDTIHNICGGIYSLLVQIAECSVSLQTEVYTTSISEEIVNRNCKIYPVPAETKLFIEFTENYENQSKPKIVTIYSLQGKVLYSNQFSESVNEIDLTNFASGAYLVRICIGDKCLVSKIIKTQE